MPNGFHMLHLSVTKLNMLLGRHCPSVYISSWRLMTRCCAIPFKVTVLGLVVVVVVAAAAAVVSTL